MKWMLMVVGLVLGASTLAAQQPPPPPAPPRAELPPMGRVGPPGMDEMGPMVGEVMGYAPDRLIDQREVLGLAPEQVSRLAALAQDARQAREKAVADAKTHRDQLADLWKQPTPDVNQVRTHAQAAMQAMQNARLAQVVATVQAKAVLTPEQRGRVAGWADARRERMGAMREGMGPQRMGPRIMNRGMMGRGWMRMRPGGPPGAPRAPADTAR